MKALAVAVMFLCILVFVAACKKPTSLDNSPAAATLRISDSCVDKDKCCVDDCGNYCSSQNGVYFRHELNGETCICFCDERPN
ncbi:MAG: hypothetical protein QXK37_03280 [Candidatus Woesearchaeota archaeon]